MNITTKHLSDTKVELTITLGKKELANAEQVALVKLSKDLKVAGFRKGKVPVEVAAKNVDPQVLEGQLMNDAISKAVAEAFTSEDIRALDRPQVDVKKYVPGETLEFTAETEIIPQVKLGDYKKLKVEKTEIKVEPKEVDEIIERMRQGFATKKETGRAAKNGDEVVIDFVGKKDGVAFEGGSSQDYSLKIGSQSFIPGFEEGIIGHKKGDEFDLDLSFPTDYHVDDLKGAKVVFSVTLKSINEVVLPELDDEFAAKSGPFTSLGDLKADIKREIKSQKEREAKEKQKDNLVDQLIAASSVPVPEVLVADQMQSIEQDFAQNLAYRGLKIDQYIESNGFKDKAEWLEKEVKSVATKRVQAGLVLAELSKLEKIDSTDEELTEHINLYKNQYANNPQALAQFDQPEVQRDIANRLVTEKTVDRLLELNS